MPGKNAGSYCVTINCIISRALRYHSLTISHSRYLTHDISLTISHSRYLTTLLLLTLTPFRYRYRYRCHYHYQLTHLGFTRCGCNSTTRYHVYITLYRDGIHLRDCYFIPHLHLESNLATRSIRVARGHPRLEERLRRPARRRGSASIDGFQWCCFLGIALVTTNELLVVVVTSTPYANTTLHVTRRYHDASPAVVREPQVACLHRQHLYQRPYQQHLRQQYRRYTRSSQCHSTTSRTRTPHGAWYSCLYSTPEPPGCGNRSWQQWWTNFVSATTTATTKLTGCYRRSTIILACRRRCTTSWWWHASRRKPTRGRPHS